MGWYALHMDLTEYIFTDENGDTWAPLPDDVFYSQREYGYMIDGRVVVSTKAPAYFPTYNMYLLED
jgi:hypothetical protein